MLMLFVADVFCLFCYTRLKEIGMLTNHDFKTYVIITIIIVKRKKIMRNKNMAEKKKKNMISQEQNADGESEQRW